MVTWLCVYICSFNFFYFNDLWRIMMNIICMYKVNADLGIIYSLFR